MDIETSFEKGHTDLTSHIPDHLVHGNLFPSNSGDLGGKAPGIWICKGGRSASDHENFMGIFRTSEGFLSCLFGAGGYYGLLWYVMVRLNLFMSILFARCNLGCLTHILEKIEDNLSILDARCMVLMCGMYLNSVEL